MKYQEKKKEQKKQSDSIKRKLKSCLEKVLEDRFISKENKRKNDIRTEAVEITWRRVKRIMTPNVTEVYTGTLVRCVRKDVWWIDKIRQDPDENGGK